MNPMNSGYNQPSTGAAPAPQGGNPIAQSYAAWAQRTPWLTRSLCVCLCVLYALSFFVRLDDYLGNIPRYTLLRGELHRLLFSPLVGNSLLTLVLGLVVFTPIASKTEASVGTAAFAALLLAVDLFVNVVFLAITAFLYFAAGVQSALYWRCADVWILVFAIMSIDCFQNPEQTRRLLFCPAEIPSRYLPFIFYLLLTLFNGFSATLSYLLAIFAGYLICNGYFDKLRPSSYTLVSAESEGGWLHSLSRRSGYVLAGTMGHDAWIAVNQNDVEEASTHSQTHSQAQTQSPFAFSSFGTGSMSESRPAQQAFPGSGHRLTEDSPHSQSTSGSLFPMPGAFFAPSAPPAMPPASHAQAYTHVVAASTVMANVPSREELAARRLAALEGRTSGAQ